MGLKENIKNRRLELGLTLEDVAKKVGVSKQTIQRYESGGVIDIPQKRMAKLTECLRTTEAALRGLDEGAEYIRHVIYETANQVDEMMVNELLEKYAKLSKEDQYFALQFVDRMVKKEK